MLNGNESSTDEETIKDWVGNCAKVLRQCHSEYPRTALVLGSGLGNFVDAMDVETIIPYGELPGFPCSTAPGHAGRIVCGTIAGIPLLAMQGRCHLYEGHSVSRITFPLRVLQSLGVQNLILTCAAGGLAPRLAVGDLLIVQDQLNLQHQPFRLLCQEGRNSVPSPYDPEDVSLLLELTGRHQIPACAGTYLSVTGPNYETRAEQRLFQTMAHAVGMSMVAESSLARELGIRVSGIAMITNLCSPDHPEQTDGDHVVQAARNAEPRLRRLVIEFLRAREITG